MHLIKYTNNMYNINVYVHTNRDLIQVFTLYKDYINWGGNYVSATPSLLV